MTTVDRIENWGNTHRIAALDYIRIIVGLFISYKGMSFLVNIQDLYGVAGGTNLKFASVVIAHYVVFFHTLGGPLIVMGLFTRVISVLQVPILLGAIFLVNSPKGFLSMGDHMELEVSILTLVAILLFIVFGAGRLSIDHIRRKDK